MNYIEYDYNIINNEENRPKGLYNVDLANYKTDIHKQCNIIQEALFKIQQEMELRDIDLYITTGDKTIKVTETTKIGVHYVEKMLLTNNKIENKRQKNNMRLLLDRADKGGIEYDSNKIHR